MKTHALILHQQFFKKSLKSVVSTIFDNERDGFSPLQSADHFTLTGYADESRRSKRIPKAALPVSSMPPVLDFPFAFADCKDLLPLLESAHHSARQQGSPHLLSFAQSIPAVEPLALLQQAMERGSPYFYTRYPSARPLTLLGIGSAITLRPQGSQRFQQAKQHIANLLPTLIQAGDSWSALAQPRLFCGFPFFADARSPLRSTGGILTLPRWQLAATPDETYLVSNWHIHPDHDLTPLLAQATTFCQGLRTLPVQNQGSLLPLLDWQLPPHSLDAFRQGIQTALQQIHAGSLHKVVLAHALDIPLEQPLHPMATLRQWQRLYPECYVFALQARAGATFWGASPERLLRVDQQQVWIDALAGSAPRGRTEGEDFRLKQHLLNSPKDQHEHRVVVQAIQQALLNLGMESPILEPPQILQLSSIQHLQTRIQAEIPSHLQLLDLLEALHPTPAVGGVPTPVACDLIRRLEPFDRGLYGAPLGWIDLHGNGEFFVGIRSALMQPQSLRLYAGAGIVADSDPDQEVAEVSLKLKALPFFSS
ncbi:MAG: isochorismate synthase [Cyanobacteriota bacterium]|nr:isochorismate synthase [Cyanobacteriota bacterium]